MVAGRPSGSVILAVSDACVVSGDGVSAPLIACVPAKILARARRRCQTSPGGGHCGGGTLPVVCRRMTDRPFLIVSDTHLGAVPESTERAFRRFLEQEASGASGLLINGDLFDF